VRRGHARLCAGVVAVALAGGLSSAAADEERSLGRAGLYLEYEHYSYLGDRGGRLADSRNALTAIPRLDWTPWKSLLLHSSTVLRQDFSEEERSRVFPYEAYLKVERESWSVQLGRQFITWGRADSVRPTDVFKRHDFTDLIENREEAIDAVKVDLFHGSWTLEGVWAPVFDPDRISIRAENRWSRLPTAAVVPGVGPVALTFRDDGRQRPAATLGSGQVGVRLSGSARGWDFAAMYYYGYDRVPTIVKREIARVDPIAGEATITLVPIHERIHVFGGDVATAVSGWGVRGEATYTLTSDLGRDVSGVNDPYFRLVGGIDRAFPRLPVGESLSVGIQYALDTEPRQPGPLDLLDVDRRLHPFQHALVVNTVWTYTEFVKLRLRSYVNLAEGDFLLQPELAWQPIDSMTVVAGADVLGGRPDTFFGRYRHNNRLRLRIAYTF
jgi:hypothetical protein